MRREDQLSDRDFVAALRAAVEAYFGAVDRWEAKYQQYYRLPGYPPRAGDDMEGEQRDYEKHRRSLEALIPRTRRLCLKHRVRDPFSGLLRISLGRYSPQERQDSAVGRSERNLVTECLLELNTASQEFAPNAEDPEPGPRRGKGSLLQRLVDYFY